jgi:hypothetical protein
VHADWFDGGRWRCPLVMSMCAAQERNFIEDMFLEPFEPEINHRRNEERDHLRKDKAADRKQKE